MSSYRSLIADPGKRVTLALGILFVAIVLSGSVQPKHSRVTIASGHMPAGAFDIGLSEAQILELVQTKGRVAARLSAVSNRLGVTEVATTTFLFILGEKAIAPEHLLPTLAELAERHKQILSRLKELETTSSSGQMFVRGATETIAQAKYDEAEVLFQSAVEGKTSDQENALGNDAASGDLLAAELEALRGLLRLQQLDPAGAVDHFARAAEMVPTSSVDLRLDYADEQADALFRDWESGGSEAALTKAIDIYQALLVERGRDRASTDWAITQNKLGIALARLGEHESGMTQLQDAVAAHRSALEELSKERFPLEWAATQNNLGAALLLLGERESGVARFQEAVSVHRAALEVIPRERSPLDWAATQNRLGAALMALGLRERGTTRLQEAVAAHRAALEEIAQERLPLQWAEAQNSIGLALLTLGEREVGIARLQEGVEAFRAALLEGMRERVPLQWGETQDNLGLALLLLGEREGGTARLQEAIAAYAAALEEPSGDRMSIDWATIIGNQGVALMLLAERTANARFAETAIRQITAAFQALQDAGHTTAAEYYKGRIPMAGALLERLNEESVSTAN